MEISTGSTAAATAMTTQEAARYLGCSPQTLARWRVEGTGPMYFKIGGLVRYDAGDLQEFRAARHRRSTAA